MRNKNQIKLHDGIVGTLILGSVVLTMTVDGQWIYLTGVVGALMIISAFTGFCPVYFLLDKFLPEKK